MSDEHHEGGPGQGGGTRLANEDALLSDEDALLSDEDALLAEEARTNAPRQRSGSDDQVQAGPPPAPSLDLRDQPPIFIDAEFRHLRERLFGSETLRSYPVSVSVDIPEEDIGNSWLEFEQLTFETPATARIPGSEDTDSDVTSQQIAAVAPTGVPDIVEVSPSEATPAESTIPQSDAVPPLATQGSEGTPPGGPLDWTTVSPQYSPRVEENESRGRLLALLALVVAIGGVGVWLLFGPNAPRSNTPKPEADNSRAAAAASASSPGMRSEARVAARSQTVVVEQQVVFQSARSSVTLSIPNRAGEGPTGPYDPEVSDVEILVAGSLVPIARDSLDERGSMTVKFPMPIREFTLDYRATGSLYETTPSKPGRGLALINPVAVSSTSELPSTIEVNGYRILNLGCVPPDKLMARCGTTTSQGWEFAGITGESGDILAQVDLPPPPD